MEEFVRKHRSLHKSRQQLQPTSCSCSQGLCTSASCCGGNCTEIRVTYDWKNVESRACSKAWQLEIHKQQLGQQCRSVTDFWLGFRPHCRSTWDVFPNGSVDMAKVT
eukprot:1159814-Pelagomonas_calceolata.AAC.1